MKIRAPWKTPAHDDQAPRQGYPPPHTLSTLLHQTSRVWTARETDARLAARGAQTDGAQADDHRSRGIQGRSRPGRTGSGAADEPAQTSGSPVSGSPAGHLLDSATSGHTSDGPRTFNPLAPRVLSNDPTLPAAGLTTRTTNQTWIDPQSTAAASPADATSSSTDSASATSRFGPMSLDGDEVVALLSGLVILILLLLVLLIWMCFRDPNRNASIDAESRHGLNDTPPVITLTMLEPSALPRSHQDVLGRAAETGPGAANWPLSQNQIRIPLRPRPNRRTLSSELSPFGYIRRSNLSDVASSVGGGGGSAPATRPASISAAWLSPSRAMFGRGGAQGGSTAPSTAPARPSSPVQQQQPLSTV
ncbi:hypothetical protein B0T11DRAFT_17954 [Plectosphaerella cucumerina]|uniref:Uncharacterized protein n=1 Tax=Plectosphaerella cucumerina TaxID=40658 RepID=A0A8K0TVQ3_9PEZI|nr:hypothetical protein B0T11DRAFT_17954 [Plectosphaerella cucumerina]